MTHNPIFEALAEPFPREEVHWRAQNINHEGTKALALAYIDARAVMRRLDEVLGPENWQDTYVETGRGRVICNLSLRIDGEWVAKSDGAGETDIEGDKGGISDAFKRAAVKWGIGRYLYALGNVWASCETVDGRDGKKRFRRWKNTPWDYVPRENLASAGLIDTWRESILERLPENATDKDKAQAFADAIITEMKSKKSRHGVENVMWRRDPYIRSLSDKFPAMHGDVMHTYEQCLKFFEEEAA